MTKMKGEKREHASEDRAKRLKAAMKANMAKRKAQARARAESKERED